MEVGASGGEEKEVASPTALSEQALAKANLGSDAEDGWVPEAMEETETRIMNSPNFSDESSSEGSEDVMDARLDADYVYFEGNPCLERRGGPDGESSSKKDNPWSFKAMMEEHERRKRFMEEKLMSAAVNKEVKLEPSIEVIRAAVAGHPVRRRYKRDPVVHALLERAMAKFCKIERGESSSSSEDEVPPGPLLPPPKELTSWEDVKKHREDFERRTGHGRHNEVSRARAASETTEEEKEIRLNFRLRQMDEKDGFANERRDIRDHSEKIRQAAIEVMEAGTVVLPDRSESSEEEERLDGRMRFFKMGKMRVGGPQGRVVVPWPDRMDVSRFLTNPHEWVKIRLVKPGEIKPSDVGHLHILDYENLMDSFGNSKLISVHSNSEEFSKKEYEIARGRNNLPCDVSLWEYREERSHPRSGQTWAHVTWKGGHVEIFESEPGRHRKWVTLEENRRAGGESPFFITKVARDPWGYVMDRNNRWLESDCSNQGRRLMVQGMYDEPGYVNEDGFFVPVFWNAYSGTWKQ